jgi:hypothetical protein
MGYSKAKLTRSADKHVIMAFSALREIHDVTFTDIKKHQTPHEGLNVPYMIEDIKERSIKHHDKIKICGNLPQSSFTLSASLRESCRLANQRGA